MIFTNAVFFSDENYVQIL